MKKIRALFRKKRLDHPPQQAAAVEPSATEDVPASDLTSQDSGDAPLASDVPAQDADVAPQDQEGAADIPPPEPEVFEPFVAAKNRVRAAHAGSDAFRSVLFFTTHKCASTFVTALLDELDAKSPYTNMNYEGAYWELGDEINSVEVPVEEFLGRNSDMLLLKHGEIYGPLRKPFDFPGREKFKHIFFFRDPRDVLVSMFYSYAYTHPEPIHTQARKIFLERRERTIEKGIDWFVLETTTENLLPRFLGYGEILQNAENPLILKYDEFSAETETFLKKIANYLDIELSDESLTKLTKFASPVRDGAPELEHKRSGRSGQWKHELKPETADKLNELFAPVLGKWGF